MIDARTRNIAFLVAGCFFMEFLDGTIVITAVPQISESLGVSASAAGLIITAYLVTVGMFIPLSSWLTLRYGYRRVFLAAIVIFTFSSVGCGLSQTLGELVALRMLQGLGGALMVPVGRMVVFESADKSQVMRLMSFIVWPALVAPIVAPLVGGVITTYASWRWIFLVNVPLGVIAFAAAWRLIDGTAARAAPRLDVRGAILTCIGLGGFVAASHLISEPHPAWALAIGTGLAAIVVLVRAVLHLLRADDPVIDLRTLRIPTLGASMAGTTPIWLAIGAVPFLLPLLFQTVFGWSPVKSGAIVLFVFVGNLAIKPTTTFLYTRFGFRRVLIVMSTGVTITTAGCSLIAAETPLAAIVALVMFHGVARSVSMTGYATLSLSEVPDRKMRPVSALISTAQQVLSGLAVVVAAIALRLAEPIRDLLAPGDARAVYSIAFLLMALIAATAVWFAWRLPADAGTNLTNGRATGATAQA
jgi:EmrB/QacA subfamily drug resistance transporter